MIIDSSALVAIITSEPDGPVLARAMSEASALSLSAVTYFETCIVIDKYRDPVLSLGLDDLIQDLDIEIEPVTSSQARTARQAYRDYGRGSGHPANLNFGDCFAYALAREKREPLLFKGNDFIHTDLRPAS
ncbi:type II toxin-antitoxin system VapC family toxin [Acidicapsa dinghuensis]|uniref:Ribonuclease VapC n=1 Tax=Acidicapsa dinghuensis TaxID=2218256 RepID=A0ABW1EHY8_9BACT|nr:type II toxin-antitoxin system VapC family toxin [Acidicapsa dinghuensis]